MSTGSITAITVVRRSGTRELYINGSSVTISNASTAPRAPSKGTYIGGNQSGSECFNWLIDSVKIYNRALSVSEISSLAN